MLGCGYASDHFNCQQEVLLYSFAPLGSLLFASAQPHLGACRAIAWVHTLAVCHHVWQRGHVQAAHVFATTVPSIPVPQRSVRVSIDDGGRVLLQKLREVL
jgi:hypothetical protein